MEKFFAGYPQLKAFREKLHMEQFATGAKRSERQRNHFHLLPSDALRRVGQRYAMAVPKGYGEYNWLKGFPFSDLFNHIQEHLENAKQAYEDAVLSNQGQPDAIARELAARLGTSQAELEHRGEDDLAGAVFGIFCLMELARRGRLSPDEGWHVPVIMSAEAPVDPREEEIKELRERNVRLQELLVQQEVEYTFSKKKSKSRGRKR